MTGNGIFGGSNNFLSILGGIGNAWGDGMISGMNMGKALMDYQICIHKPISYSCSNRTEHCESGTAEGTHYKNSIIGLNQLSD